MLKTLATVVCALALLGVGIAIFFTHKESSSPQASDTQNVQHSVLDNVAAASTLPEGMREYRSAAYRFSFFYPQELSVVEYPEGGGAVTITFQNVEKAEGFQIFIVPYSEPQVSLPAQAGEQRFKEDVPSGVRESLANITVDGATGNAFYSEDADLGATREVWVVHGGFLYELTTHRSLDTWLDAIIQTWRFTL